MMYTTNRIFVDSSVLPEAFKDKKVNLYNGLISNINNELCISEIVLSEYLFYILAISGGKSPQSLHEKGSIPELLTSVSIDTLIPKDFSLLKVMVAHLDLVPGLMIKYNLLPNDAIILATCKLHGITQLASHDNDFIEPCKGEGISLLREE